jgi:hypothetical protein
MRIEILRLVEEAFGKTRLSDSTVQKIEFITDLRIENWKGEAPVRR